MELTPSNSLCEVNNLQRQTVVVHLLLLELHITLVTQFPQSHDISTSTGTLPYHNSCSQPGIQPQYMHKKPQIPRMWRKPRSRSLARICFSALLCSWASAGLAGFELGFGRGLAGLDQIGEREGVLSKMKKKHRSAKRERPTIAKSVAITGPISLFTRRNRQQVLRSSLEYGDFLWHWTAVLISNAISKRYLC